MTDKEINVAIAQACGWKEVRVNGNAGIYKGFDNGAELRPDLPDYCTDLNAMHEAETTLSDDQLWRMAREIERNEEQWYFRATARQRAEAFLRTLGKWEDVRK
jgi:hypothetical protein